MTRDQRNETIRELRYVDGLSCPKIAPRFGLAAKTVQGIAPGYPGKIDNARLREAFIRSGKSASAVARDLGWTAGEGKGPDASRVRKTLGITGDVNGQGKKSVRRRVDAEMAARIAESIGVEPWEVGYNDA